MQQNRYEYITKGSISGGIPHIGKMKFDFDQQMSIPAQVHGPDIFRQKQNSSDPIVLIVFIGFQQGEGGAESKGMIFNDLRPHV